MNFPLEDKVALVTGGAIRVGRAIALALARAGCDVVIHYRNSRDEALALAEEIQSLGRQSWALYADFAEEDAAESLLRSAWDTAGWLDVLVNNAALYSRIPAAEADALDFTLPWRVNALAPMLLSKAFVECIASSTILPEDYRGQIINVLDRRIATTDPGALPYWLSKKTLEAYTLGAAREFAPRIAVNAIAPGPALPPESPDMAGERAGFAPLPTRCSPEDIGTAALYLASSRCITGQILFVDSGQHLIG